VAFNTASPDQPALVEWMTDDPFTIARTMIDSTGSFHFMLAPRYPGGRGGIDNDAGRISIDYAELLVKFRSP
jgi:hypothetical protein